MQNAPFRICTYNVENLFLADEGPLKPHKAVRPLLRMIEQVGADLVVLQEVGSKTSLELLNSWLPNPYEFVDLMEGNSNRSIHLGVLSRVPIELTSHRDLKLQADGEPLFIGIW